MYLEVGWEHGLDLSGSRWGQVAGFVNAVMNFRFPKKAGIFFSLAKDLSASQIGLLHGFIQYSLIM
jgi:hypothetical protein